MSPPAEPRLPERTRRYLADACLAPLWTAVRGKLERGRLAVAGTVTVTLDENGADRLSGLLGKPVAAGRIRVPLTALDEALRSSAAAAGLVTVVAQITGDGLVDRAAIKERAHASWADVWAQLDVALAAAGAVRTHWAPAFVEGIRRSGLLTRAGIDTAAVAVAQFAAVLAELSASGGFGGPITRDLGWEIAELAGRCLGDAHGLDDGRLPGSLVLRAAAAAFGVALPETAEERRDLWARLGVATDLVSGTALVWSLRPPGSDPWSAMMRERADMGLVTHLTLHELRGAAADARLAAPGTQVFACENPQVLQAAARARVAVPMVCPAGNPSVAGWVALRRLVDAGVTVRYHGDFDWPGVAIAARMFAAGLKPWRMSADDYRNAVATLPPDARLALTGSPNPTPWDPVLEDAMRRRNFAVHEEMLLPTLLTDLRAYEAAPSALPS
ncbi:TIGR02679 family protein [Streptosporangium vulgare]|uniref:TIGR02679 family protein n=1 Tax=Streptosporangium vulgare TaxID=46190 RepID=A0ABV5TKU7_9ACTN